MFVSTETISNKLNKNWKIINYNIVIDMMDIFKNVVTVLRSKNKIIVKSNRTKSNVVMYTIGNYRSPRVILKTFSTVLDTLYTLVHIVLRK